MQGRDRGVSVNFVSSSRRAHAVAMAVAMASTPRIAICITGFEHAFSEIEANVQYSIETLAAKRRPHVFGVVPSNRTWPLVERMLTRMGWMDDATISQQQPGNLTAPSNFWPSEKRRSFMLELWDCDQCHQMITESERAGGYRFDLISRFRLDLYWELPFHYIPDKAMPRGEMPPRVCPRGLMRGSSVSPISDMSTAAPKSAARVAAGLRLEAEMKSAVRGEGEGPPARAPAGEFWDEEDWLAEAEGEAWEIEAGFP